MHLEGIVISWLFCILGEGLIRGVAAAPVAAGTLLSSTAFCYCGAALPFQDVNMQVTSKRKAKAQYLCYAFRV